MVGYYDAVLGFIPLSLLGLAGLLYWIGLTLGLAITVAGIVAAGAIGHAMFVNAPTARDDGRRSAEPAAD